MRLSIGITILFIILSSGSQAQNPEKYSDVDTLISTNSLIDAMSAIRILKENYTKDTTNARYWLRISKASYTAYKYENAKAAINKAIVLSPSVAVYYFEKGLLHNRINELDPAIQALEKAISLEANGLYYYWKGIVNQQLKNNEAAETDYEKAISLKFEQPELFNNLALLLTEKENYQRALEMIHKAIALNKTYSQAYSARSKIYFLMLNVDSSCADKNRALSLGYRKSFNMQQMFLQEVTFIIPLLLPIQN